MEINKNMISGLIEYVNTLLDFIDVEEEENINYINNGYNEFVEPFIKMLKEE